MDSIQDAILAHGMKRRGQIVSDFQSKNISGKIIEKAESSTGEEGGDHWITINGRHILLGEGGEVKAGGKGMADGGDLKKVGGEKSDSSLSEKVKKHGSHRTTGGASNYEGSKLNFTPEDKNGKTYKIGGSDINVPNKPSDKDLRAKEFESIYSKKEAKVYAEGGVPKTKKEENGRHIDPVFAEKTKQRAKEYHEAGPGGKTEDGGYKYTQKTGETKNPEQVNKELTEQAQSKKDNNNSEKQLKVGDSYHFYGQEYKVKEIPGNGYAMLEDSKGNKAKTAAQSGRWDSEQQELVHKNNIKNPEDIKNKLDAQAYYGKLGLRSYEADFDNPKGQPYYDKHKETQKKVFDAIKGNSVQTKYPGRGGTTITHDWKPIEAGLYINEKGTILDPKSEHEFDQKLLKKIIKK